ncbi:hypothetical protein HW555_006607 [Spodoptera exigua]|uniref:Enhancer of mRNA-decapping protein 4 C-terminal domain-containing protein n=1 Tax=Spodoptera exigua TaxID=7107 RepID=A0A835L680_SPOEX|nr:hypothetical protein HW555_006607 [Spodoptera exigua]
MVRTGKGAMLVEGTGPWRSPGLKGALPINTTFTPCPRSPGLALNKIKTVSYSFLQRPHRNVTRNCVQESLPFLLQMQVAQIQSLIASGDVNGAFQQALSASDLALVVMACRAAEPAQVFGPPCKLKQHVLLSLVQQLAADMARDTPLKHRYLEEAVMNLDTSNPVTREHLPAVVRELQKQLVSFLAAAPHHALARQLRMLLMATEALVKVAA